MSNTRLKERAERRKIKEERYNKLNSPKRHPLTGGLIRKPSLEDLCKLSDKELANEIEFNKLKIEVAELTGNSDEEYLQWAKS